MRLTWKGGEVKDHDVGRREAWDECSGGMMMNDDEEPNNLCWKEKS